MHHPGALEAVTLGALVALAVEAVALARKRPFLRPVAVGLALLASIEVGRLWTRHTALDRVLFVAWAGVTVAPAVAVLGHRAPAWGRAAVVVVAGALAGVLVALVSPAFRGPFLRPLWPGVLASTRMLATAVTGYALGERMYRAGGRWLPLTREEQAALVLPAAQLADLLLWSMGLANAWWVARVLALVTYAAHALILASCPRSAKTSSSSPLD